MTKIIEGLLNIMAFIAIVCALPAIIYGLTGHSYTPFWICLAVVLWCFAIIGIWYEEFKKNGL